MKLWWGYLHVNGSMQAKLYFGPEDIWEATESAFAAEVFLPFEASGRADALKKLNEMMDARDFGANDNGGDTGLTS